MSVQRNRITLVQKYFHSLREKSNQIFKLKRKIIINLKIGLTSSTVSLNLNYAAY